MAISNIRKTGGTVATPILSANIDNIEFTNIPGGNKGTKGSTFWNNSENVNVWKNDGDGTLWKPSVNGVDIDWNSAEITSTAFPSMNRTINTTGDLLSWIKEGIEEAAVSGRTSGVVRRSLWIN